MQNSVINKPGVLYFYSKQCKKVNSHLVICAHILSDFSLWEKLENSAKYRMNSLKTMEYYFKQFSHIQDQDLTWCADLDTRYFCWIWSYFFTNCTWLVICFNVHKSKVDSPSILIKNYKCLLRVFWNHSTVGYHFWQVVFRYQIRWISWNQLFATKSGLGSSWSIGLSYKTNV